MALKNTITFSAPPAAGVTRVATITIGTAAPITLDVTDPTTTFPSNDGDTGTVSAIDSDSAGPSPASNLFSFTTTAPVSPPLAPVITGVVSALA